MRLIVETIKPFPNSSNNDIICRVDINGNLDFRNTDEFKFIINALIKGGVKKLVLDVYDVGEIDSMGIGSFINLQKSFSDKKGEIVITRCNDQLLTLFKPIKIEKLIRIFRTVKDGVDYLKSLKF